MDGISEQRRKGPWRRWIPRILVAVVLIGCALLVYNLVTSGVADYQDQQDADRQAQEAEQAERRKERRQEQQEINSGSPVYVVQEGDTMTKISEETGVPMRDLLELNPGLDTQVLTPGQEITLREE
jgi:LysM repeat protein